MNSRTMVKVSAAGQSLFFRTVTRNKKSPHSFAVLRSDLRRMVQEGSVTISDAGSFAVLRYERELRRVVIRFVWLNQCGCALTGREETVQLSFDALMKFALESEKNPEVTEWRALSMEDAERPRLVFCEQRNLRAALAQKTVQRKLIRFLRDNFRWKQTDRICFYDDPLPYSFFFREFRLGRPGICGGVILHGQDHMEKAQYALHT